MAVGSVLTVFTTSMIYAQLKTIPKWNNWITPVCYLLFSLLSGSLLAACFGYWQKIGIFPVAFLGLALLASSWGAKLFWWSRGDTLEERGSSTGTATGLGKIGKVKLFERPHSGENYLTREMVHKIGRKHAAKIRVIALLFGAILPAIFCLIAMIGSSIAPFLFVLAFVCLMAGLFAERWLFFAEAKHAVSLYYD